MALRHFQKSQRASAHGEHRQGAMHQLSLVESFAWQSTLSSLAKAVSKHLLLIKVRHAWKRGFAIRSTAPPIRLASPTHMSTLVACKPHEIVDNAPAGHAPLSAGNVHGRRFFWAFFGALHALPWLRHSPSGSYAPRNSHPSIDRTLASPSERTVRLFTWRP